MPVCKDPRLTCLNQVGCNVITLPRTGIDHQHVVGRDRANAMMRL
jgi:hypothetical protein